MASSFSYSFLVVCLTSLLVSASALASTKFIDAICQNVEPFTTKAFCVQTLTAYPPTASATTALQAAVAALNLGISYAEKSEGFAGKAAKENPTLKEQFIECQDAFMSIKGSFLSAVSELKHSPDAANYGVFISRNYTMRVKELVGNNKDKDSKTIMKMTLMMNKLQGIAVGATVVVGS